MQSEDRIPVTPTGESERADDVSASPAELTVPDVVTAACEFVRARGRPALFYLLGEGDDAEHRPDVPITRRTVEQVASALDDDVFPELDLVIQSAGGDIHAAYQIITMLRRHLADDGTITACVPRRAASAAMLLTLGSDRILLGETATLSPLDAQINMGVTSAGTPSYTSALHLLKGLDRLREFAVETFAVFAGRLYQENPDRSEKVLLESSIEFSRAIAGPLLQRIDSPNLGFWDQMLHTGEVYATELLTRSDLLHEADADSRGELAARVVHDLVNKYPSHEMIVGIEQLRQLNLRSELMDKALSPAARRFASCSSSTLIMLAQPPGSAPTRGVPSGTVTSPGPADWAAVGSDSAALSLVHRIGDREFPLRVGLYRPRIVTSNPWEPGSGPGRGEGPSSAWWSGLPGAPTGERPPWYDSPREEGSLSTNEDAEG